MDDLTDDSKVDGKAKGTTVQLPDVPSDGAHLHNVIKLREQLDTKLSHALLLDVARNMEYH